VGCFAKKVSGSPSLALPLRERGLFNGSMTQRLNAFNDLILNDLTALPTLDSPT
jgi:hypothetical protein